MHIKVRTILTLALTMVPDGTKATEAPAWPSLAVFPWQHPGIDPDSVAAAHNSLETARSDLARSLTKSPTKFDQWLVEKQKPLTINAKELASSILVGEGRQGPGPLILVPIWCPIANHFVIFLEITNPSTNMLLASEHLATPKSRWNPTAPGFLTSTLQQLAASALERVRTQSPQSDQVMKLGLTLAKNTSRLDEGSGYCLNALMASTLLEQHAVLRHLGEDTLTFMRKALAITPPSHRATRKLITNWDIAAQNLPQDLTLRLRGTEAVLGGRVLPETSERMTLAIMGKRLTLSPSPAVANFVATETAALAPGDRPRVVKVDRAWAYLDRGRAWGLDLNDRLVYQNGDAVIKGHVVGFYGPHLALKAPGGSVVAEGAILYIRTGQEKLSVGQSFSLDNTAYPTAWPPAK